MRASASLTTSLRFFTSYPRGGMPPIHRRIARPGILEPILRYRDGVRAATPFPNQTRAGLQAEARRRGEREINASHILALSSTNLKEIGTMIRCVRIWTAKDGNSEFEEGTIDLSK